MIKFLTLTGLRLLLFFCLMTLLLGWVSQFRLPPAIQRINCQDGAMALWDRQHGNQIPFAEQNLCVSSAVWSPDGTRIAFAQHNRSRSPELIVSVLNLETLVTAYNSQAVYRVRDRIYETRIQWSPNGQWLIFVVRAGSTPLRMWVVKADGSEVYDYTRFILYDPAVFFWSADNQHIYIRMVEFSAETRATHLLKLPVSESPEPIVIEDMPLSDTVWVYPTQHAGEMLTINEAGIWLVNLDTRNIELIVQTYHWERIGKIDTRWSSDSEQLAVIGRTKNKEILLQIIQLDTSDSREILIPVAGDVMPHWSIADFHQAESIRITSPDADGVTCVANLHSGNVSCESGYDSRRFIDRPTQ